MTCNLVEAKHLGCYSCQVPSTNFPTLETLLAMDRISQWICSQAICKYVYPLLTCNSTLSNLVMDLICIHTSVVEAGHWWQWWSNKRSMHECITVYCTADTVHVQAILLQWCPHWWNKKDLSCVLHEWHIVVCTCPHVVKFREQGVCVCELIYFLSSLYVIYLCCSCWWSLKHAFHLDPSKNVLLLQWEWTQKHVC